MGRVDDRVVIVTGGAQGIGAAIARRLTAEGAKVVIGDVLADKANELVEELGPTARFVHLDVTDEQSWIALVSRVESEVGAVSGLVNNAGVVRTGPIESLSEADFRSVIDVNQLGVFLGMKQVLPAMRRAGGGSMVNVSSIGGIIAFPGILGYTASKWAVRGMTKSAAQEFGPAGVRVNSLHPGIVATDMTEDAPGTNDLVQGQPLPRPGRPEELANLALFLISAESAYCTGSEFVADGGYTSM